MKRNKSKLQCKCGGEG